ncbi:MAG: hypothetical protein QOH16_1477 [Gaiellaceae bacterium]|nr:hypothetical protein [Gaiellaceae bacterium]
MPSSNSQFFNRPSASELGIPQMTLPELREVARRLPFEWAYIGLSLIQARLTDIWRDGWAQLELLREIYGDVPLLDRYDAFLKAHSTAALFGAQDIYVAQRLLIDHARDVDATEPVDFDDDVHLSTLLIHAPGIVDAANPLTRVSGQPTLHDVVAAIQLGAAVSARPPAVNELGRFFDVFAVRARDRVNPDVPLDEWAQKEYKLTLEQQIAGGFGYGAMAMQDAANGKLGLVAPTILATTKLASVEQHVLDAVSGDRDWFRQEFARGDQTERDVAWEVFPFIRRPFLRLHDARLVLCSPTAIWTWNGFGIYDRLRTIARDQPHKAGSKLDLFGQVVGDLIEDYAVDIARSVYPSGRVFSDADWSTVHPPDLAIALGDDLVVVEVRSGFLSPWFRTSGDLDEFDKQMKRHVHDKLDQLGSCIAEIEAGTATLADVDLGAIKRIWPVLITVPLAITEHFWMLIDPQIPPSLCGGRSQQLVIADMPEFELLMGAIEQGTDLIQTLHERQQTPFKHLELGRWLVDRAGVPWTCRPRLVVENWDRARTALNGALWPDDGTGAPTN